MEKNEEENKFWTLFKGGFSSVLIFAAIVAFNMFLFWLVLQIFNDGKL